MEDNRNKTYEAFSLVEMLITMVIIGIVMVTSALVLTTLIKVSTVTTNKTRVRTESEYMQEILKRTIRTTDPSNVQLYNTIETDNPKIYNPESSLVTGSDDAYEYPLDVNLKGNEIHLRPFGSNRWTCVGFFKSGEMERIDNTVPEGYILKTSMPEEKYAPDKCFNSTENDPSNYIVLNSRFVNVSKLEMMYTESVDGNKEYFIDLYADALYWYFSKGAPLNREIVRQTIVKTESVKW